MKSKSSLENSRGMRIHSLLSPKCEARNSAISGRGVFALAPFEAGELVAVWGGKVYSAEEVERLADIFPHFATHTYSVYDGYYFGSENLFELDDAELFNHSCEPNVGVQGQIVVVARRPIATGEELVFDYDTTETSAEPFACRCRSARCRGTIEGAAWRDADFVRENWNYLSWYIQEKIRREVPEMADEWVRVRVVSPVTFRGSDNGLRVISRNVR